MAGKAKTQQKRWHLDGGIEVTNIQEENGDQRPSTFLGNYNGDNAQSLALVAYTGSYYDLIDYPDLTSYVVDGNYVHTDNNFTDADKAKLAASYNYVLPVATEKILGGVKVGDHLEMRVDPKIKDPKEKAKAPLDRLSVIESHFIYIQNADNVTRFSQIPTNSAGQITLAPMYTPEKWNPTNELSEEESNEIKPETGNYIRYNDMAFFSQDPDVKTKEYNGKTMKIDQDYMSKGGLWWTTSGANRWIRILDQFNIISFNNRVGKVMPVGMDDYKYVAEDYTADMVGAIARISHEGSYSIEDRRWNGVSLEDIENNSASWGRIGRFSTEVVNGRKQYKAEDTVNSPTGGPYSGIFWKLSGLPTLPTYDPKTGYPDTYRGINQSAMFIIGDREDRIWVKRGNDWENNKWFYLEQLPIATRSRLGGVIIGDGLNITEEGVLSVSGLVTSWTGKQGARRVNDVVAINGDYDAKMITFGSEWSDTTNVDYELKRLQRVLDTKAPLASPVFTGRPMTPTPGANDNSQQIVNIQWVRNHVATELQNVVGYTLPPATTSTLGGVIVGNGLSISTGGVLSVNLPSGSGNVVVDTSVSTTSQNPVANSAITQYVNTIDNKFGDYVLKLNGTAQNLTLTGNAKYTTLPKGTSNDLLATTKFVMDALDDAIQVIGGGSGGSVVINPYTLPPASANVRGGVRVVGDKGIKIESNDCIIIDKDYLQGGATYANGGKLNYITSKENITGGTFADIPMNSSGVTRLSAAYSPTAKDMQGYYIKYNAGDNPDSYIMWFCDFDTNNSYYLVYKSASEYAWSMTFAVEGMDNYQDFDIRLYAKLDSPQFTGLPTVPDADTWDDNSSQIANTRFVNTFVTRKLQNQQKAGYGSQFGVVAVKQGGGIKVNAGVIEMDGVVSFKGRKGAVTPQLGDYTSSLVNNSSSIDGSTVTDALNNIKSNYALLNSPAFTGVPTIGTGSTKSPIATEYYVRQWKPIAKKAGSGTANVGMVQIGDGLDIDTNGVLSVVGSVTGWTGNQGTRQTGEVIATAGDYNSNMIYYDPQDDSKTVRSELDLKAYDDQVWHKKDINSYTEFNHTNVTERYSGGRYGSYGGHIMLPMAPASYSGNHSGIIILNNDANSYGNGVASIPNLYIASTYTEYTGQPGQNAFVTKWSGQIRILTTRDLTTINGSLSSINSSINSINNDINTIRITPAGSSLGMVKNGGNIAIDSEGKMNYALPIATSSILGGVKVGNGLAVALDGTLSVSGAVTTWNGRSGNVTPESGDYTSAQITYDTIKTVKDKLDEIDASISSFTDGSGLPIASTTQIGAVKIGDGINVDSDGVISMSGVTSFNGRGGTVVPEGNEQDYTADMVGAIAKRINISANMASQIPNNSAGSVTIGGENRGYVRIPILGDRDSNVTLFFKSAKKIINSTYVESGSLSYYPELYYSIDNSYYSAPIRLGGSFDRVDNYGSEYSISINEVRYDSDRTRTRTFNTAGITKTRLLKLDNAFIEKYNLISTYLDISSDPINTSNSGKPRARYSLTIASFYEETDIFSSVDCKVQGVYYNRAPGNAVYNSSIDGEQSWIKLIDSQNISDYIPDTSSFYNTENYTTTEISDEITATLAELNA